MKNLARFMVIALLFSLSSCTLGTYYTGWAKPGSADNQRASRYNLDKKYKGQKKKRDYSSTRSCEPFRNRRIWK